MIISKADFTDDLVRWSPNIPDSLINPDIADAIKFDLDAVVSGPLKRAILNVPDFNAVRWISGGTYPIGTLVRAYDPLGMAGIYRALVLNPTQVPGIALLPLEVAQWEYSDIHTFLDGYVKPYLVVCAYFRYKREAGIIPTPSGDRIFREDESDPISPVQHATQLAKYKEKRGDYAAQVLAELSRRGYLIGGVQYTRPNDYCHSNVNPMIYRGGVSAI